MDDMLFWKTLEGVEVSEVDQLRADLAAARKELETEHQRAIQAENLVGNIVGCLQQWLGVFRDGSGEYVRLGWPELADLATGIANSIEKMLSRIETYRLSSAAPTQAQKPTPRT